jgi:membrane protease YdiL (CAAX protease family)
VSKAKLSEQIWGKSSGWVDQIGEVIGKMAKQLGIASEHVYEVYTKQIFFEGVVWSCVYAFFVLLLVVAYTVLWVNTKNLKDRWGEVDNESKWFARGMGFLVLAVVGSMIITLGLVPSLFKVFNPEYYTIKEIMSMIKSVVK